MTMVRHLEHVQVREDGPSADAWMRAGPRCVPVWVHVYMWCPGTDGDAAAGAPRHAMA